MFCEAERIIQEIRASEARMEFRLAAIGRHLGMLQHEVYEMTQATDSLQAAVEKETTVEQSAITLIQGLSDQLRQTSTDPLVQQFADRINASATALGAAVAANTQASTTSSAPNANLGNPAPATAPAQPAPATDTGNL